LPASLLLSVNSRPLFMSAPGLLDIAADWIGIPLSGQPRRMHLRKQRFLGHLQVQILPRPRVRFADGFVELDTEPGFLRRNNPAVLPLDFLLQKLFVEAIPLLERFQNEEVWQRRGKLDVGRAGATWM
jgi:hypothetical protein